MKHLELHIIQSFPVTCLNRDDLNSPKTAVFGGVQRARVSSQCWKSAVREMMRKESDNKAIFQGMRGRWIIGKFQDEFLYLKQTEDVANALAICVGHYLGKIDAKNVNRVKTSLFLSPMELKAISKKIVVLESEKKIALERAIDKIDLSEIEKEEESEDGLEKENTSSAAKSKVSKENKLSPKNFTKLVEKILKPVFSDLYKKEEISGLPKDAADIAIFGRMVANDSSINIEGAASFNHALSVHKVDNEIDYFSAIDEMQPKEETGAAITGTLEFNSATYYRFAALNLDMLFDKDHLACLNERERKEVVKTFVKSVIEAVPVARRNSQNGDVRPKHVLCVIREKGHPVQLVNAFEEPIFSKNGVTKKSIEELEKEYTNLKEKWEVPALSEIRLPEKKMSELLVEVDKYVK